MVVLIHGGAWFSGQKEDMLEFVPFLERDFPEYCIANMNYRLGQEIQIYVHYSCQQLISNLKLGAEM